MKRSSDSSDSAHAVDSSDSEEQGAAKRQRRMSDVDFLSGYDDERESDSASASDGDSKESSDSATATAMEICSEDEDYSLFAEPLFGDLEERLHDNIVGQDVAGVEELLKEGANVLAQDDTDESNAALHCAMRARVDNTITTQLLEAMADVEVRNADSLTPILVAADVVHMDGIRLLIAAGADLRAVDTATRETILHKLVQSECGTECLREMVCKYGLDMRARGFKGNIPAFTAFNNYNSDEGVYLARMKYIMGRVYNKLYVKCMRRKVTPVVDSALMASSSDPVPYALARLAVDYLFFVEDNKKSIKSKVMSYVDSCLTTDSSSPFPHKLTRLIVDYLDIEEASDETEVAAAMAVDQVAAAE